MMKKVSYIFRVLTIVSLLFATAGFTVSYHYCDDQLVVTSLNEKTDPCCDFMGSENCCRTETEFVQMADAFLTSCQGAVQTDDSTGSVPAVLEITHSVNNLIQDLILTDYSGSPPEKCSERLSLLQTYLC